ncbi:S-layer homology domain-containing protein [Paenibacillus aceris]|uniref:S-layer homology domain-containing protein n=1 Tax=Paenibacillus aceris TaxID=869555 RepID=A0ABS4HX80_9BACL|nr:S-layer homology domain-containing protein [Paenibacillus aceris]MBP1963095.1 hypothetical protein [Paenibacillus aceris]NHW38784.1 hypothetical protein [Paenibacillus aceris]
MKRGELISPPSVAEMASYTNKYLKGRITLLVKKLLAFSLTLLLTVFMLPQPFIYANTNTSPSFLLSITKPSISAGENFEVKVEGKQLTDMYAFEVNLSFDTSRLEFRKNDFQSSGFTVGPNVDGNIIQIAYTQQGNTPGQSGDVTLATLPFHAVSQGSAEIVLDSVKLMKRVDSKLVTEFFPVNSKVVASIQNGNEVKIPAVPSGLTATATSTTQINVTWNHSKDATGYDLMVDGVVQTDRSSPFAHTGLAADSTHTYRVRAKNSAGVSEWSSQVSATSQRSSNNNNNNNGNNNNNNNGNNNNNNGNNNNNNGNNNNNNHNNKNNAFNSDIINEFKLVNSISSWVAEAKKADEKVELADIKGHWGKKTIGTFVKLHVIDGYGDGTFHPDGNITRAEFAAIISRVFDINGGANQSVILNDIENHWGKEAIEKLASAGVIAGYGDGTFKPDKTISREEMVIILSRIVDFNNVDKDASKGNFADIARASSYAANHIKDAAEAGIISGKDNALFDPQGNSTRAEALTIVLNALNLNPQVKILLDSLNEVEQHVQGAE